MLRIFIIGTTGVGKTKLSVSLAHHFQGQIISSDSKQLYKHASIMTAKVTAQQAQGIPHHMIDCLELHQNAYNRNKYLKDAWPILEEIEGRNRMGIVVGGTNYYTEMLMFAQGEGEGKQGPLQMEKQVSLQTQKQLQHMRSLSKQDKFSLLQKHDPKISLKLHRNDQQKITLFLQRIIRSGQALSHRYQKDLPTLRTGREIVLWLRNSNKQQLYGMVSKRIGDMLDQRGVGEILSVYYYVDVWRRGRGGEVRVEDMESYSGAAASIGIREFKDLYLEAKEQIEKLFQGKPQINYEIIHKKILQNIKQLQYSPQTLNKCRQQLLIDTRQYCKRQITWIRNRLFTTPQNSSNFFILQLSQQPQSPILSLLQRFNTQILDRAIHIITTISNQGFGSIKQKQQQFQCESRVQSLDEWRKYYCQVCKIELNGLYNWESHVKSKRHMKMEKYLEKREEHQRFVVEQKEKARMRKIQKENKQQNQRQESQKKEEDIPLVDKQKDQ